MGDKKGARGEGRKEEGRRWQGRVGEEGKGGTAETKREKQKAIRREEDGRGGEKRKAGYEREGERETPSRLDTRD